MVSREDLVSCYRILGLAPGASLEAARQAYKPLVRRWHPDQFMHDESMRRMAERHMKIINTAYKTLSEFLSFRPPFHLNEERRTSPRRTAEGKHARGRRRESAVIRFRVRTKAWWARFRFSFEDPEFFGQSAAVFFKTMSYGLIAWALFIGSFAVFEALPRSTPPSFLANDVGLAVHFLAMYIFNVTLRWGVR